MTVSRMAALIAASTALTFAQGLPTEKVLTSDVASAIAQATIAKCRADGFHITVVVLDRGNAYKALLRDDGSGMLSIDVARGKALAALAFGRSSAEAGKMFAAIPNAPQSPGLMAVGGALPIKVGEDVIGAVGVSGAPGGEKDEACAAAGLAKVADRLK